MLIYERKISNFFGVYLYELFFKIDKIRVWRIMRNIEFKLMLMVLRDMEWL